jgi:hypothetical protein
MKKNSYIKIDDKIITELTFKTQRGGVIVDKLDNASLYIKEYPSYRQMKPINDYTLYYEYDLFMEVYDKNTFKYIILLKIHEAEKIIKLSKDKKSPNQFKIKLINNFVLYSQNIDDENISVDDKLLLNKYYIYIKLLFNMDVTNIEIIDILDMSSSIKENELKILKVDNKLINIFGYTGFNNLTNVLLLLKIIIDGTHDIMNPEKVYTLNNLKILLNDSIDKYNKCTLNKNADKIKEIYHKETDIYEHINKFIRYVIIDKIKYPDFKQFAESINIYKILKDNRQQILSYWYAIKMYYTKIQRGTEIIYEPNDIMCDKIY